MMPAPVVFRARGCDPEGREVLLEHFASEEEARAWMAAQASEGSVLEHAPWDCTLISLEALHAGSWLVMARELVIRHG